MGKDLKPKLGPRYYMDLTGGCLYKPESAKDYEFSAILSATMQLENRLPEFFSLWTPEVKNQQVKETCVAHALSSAMEILSRYYNGSMFSKYSTVFSYGARSEGQYEGEGMYISEALANLKEFGLPKETGNFSFNLNYKEAKKYVEENPALFDQAKEHKISGYARVRTENEMMKALYFQKTPIIVGMSIYESFYNVNATGIVPKPKENEKCYGGHAMIITGWTEIDDEPYWVVQNSWGNYFGDNGFCYIPFACDDLFYEKWVIVLKKFLEKKFSDVNKDSWSAEFIDKAVKRGLVEGFPDGTFKPGESVTREQLCVVLAKLLDKLEGEE